MVPANSDTDPPLFSAVLRPHRSLGPSGFVAVMAVISVFSFFGGVVFWKIGAWPVPGFLGADIVLIYVAFRLSYRQARAAEIIALTRSEHSVRRIAPDGRAALTILNPYWARLDVERHPEFGVLRVAIAWQGYRLALGRFLGPREREAFARDFGAALALVRTVPASESGV